MQRTTTATKQIYIDVHVSTVRGNVFIIDNFNSDNFSLFSVCYPILKWREKQQQQKQPLGFSFVYITP